MTIDGFDPEEHGARLGPTDPAAQRAFDVVDWLARRLAVEVEGLERLPSGPAILVANHAFGWDVVFAMAAVRARQGRTVWALGEHLWWKIPFLRRIATLMGTVDGTPANVDRLLQRGELVLVLPGGLREAVKPRELRYRLLWGHRYGFVRAAVRNGAPLVPLAAIGADDWFDFVGDAYRRGARWSGTSLPLPLPARLLPIPHLVRLRYVIGEPIYPAPRPEGATELEHVQRVRREVEGALHELIDAELARRAGVALE